MSFAKQLSARIATYRDAEARALIHFLAGDDATGVAIRLDLTPEQARENVAQRALDFLAEAEAKLPRSAQ